VVVVSPQFNSGIRRSDVDTLWHVARPTDSRIEPISGREPHWAEDDVGTVLEIARREGEPATASW
jgi:hypothetical protein